MGWFSKLFGKKDNATAEAKGENAGKFGHAADAAGLADLQGAQDEMLAKIDPAQQTDATNAVNAAAKQMVAGDFREAIASYSAIAEQYPEKRGMAFNQIGAAHFFLREYLKAMDFYVMAGEHGEDAGMVEDNLKEAREAFFSYEEAK